MRARSVKRVKVRESREILHFLDGSIAEFDAFRELLQLEVGETDVAHCGFIHID